LGCILKGLPREMMSLGTKSWNRGIFVVVLCTYDEILPLKQ
jgi:hypothetical protein